MKKRLDLWLVEQRLAETREKAQALILAGSIWCGEVRLEKPGMQIKEGAEITVRSRTLRFASRAGDKLAFALEHFGIEVNDRVCLDIGASTGGFTDCLISKGAHHVFAVDVGYGQMDQGLRSNPKVTCIERTNARYLTSDKVSPHSLASQIDMATIDVSFISAFPIIRQLRTHFTQIRDWVLLFKPQFEVGRIHVKKGGVVKNEEITQITFQQLSERLRVLGCQLKSGPERSPIAGKKSGNVEWLAHYETIELD